MHNYEEAGEAFEWITEQEASNAKHRLIFYLSVDFTSVKWVSHMPHQVLCLWTQGMVQMNNDPHPEEEISLIGLNPFAMFIFLLTPYH